MTGKDERSPERIQRAAAVKVAAHCSGNIALAAKAVLDGDGAAWWCLRMVICGLAENIGTGNLDAIARSERDVEMVWRAR